MLTNDEYKKMVEQKFNKPLKDIMYELCIERGLEKWDGAKVLGIPIDTFVKWRTNYRFGPDQYRADMAEKKIFESINNYKKELKNIDLKRELVFQNEVSLRGFKEIVERMVELKKSELSNDTMLSDDWGFLNINILNSINKYVEQYENGSLQKRLEKELKSIEQ